MIGFVLNNGDVITLDAKAKVEFELVSSLFDDDIPAAHSTSIQITDVNGNFKKLGFVNRFDLLQRTIKHDNVQMVIDGRPEYTGKLYVRRKNKKGLSAFYIPNGFAADILDQTLQNVNYGADVTLGANTAAIVTAANGYVAQNYPAVNFNFPSLYAPKAYNINDAVAWRGVDNTEELDYEQDYEVNDFVRFTIDATEPNLRAVYRCVTAAAAGETPFTHPAKWTLETGNCIINNWDDAASSFKANDITGLETFNKYALSPQLFTKFILKRIGGTYGHQVIGEFMQDPKTDQALTHNNVLLDAGLRQYYVRAEQDGVYDASFNPNAGSGVQVVGASSPALVFNDEVTAPNEDADGILTQAGTASRYTIQNAGTHTITFYLSISSNTSTASTRIYIKLPYSGSTPNAGDPYGVITTAYTGLVKYSYTYEALPADVGNYMQFEIGLITGGNFLAIDAGSYVQVENNAADNMNRYKGTVQLSQHVPDVTIADFLISVKRRFKLNVIIDPRSKVLRLDYAKSILDNQPQDYTDIIQDTAFDFTEPEGLTIKESFDAGLDVTDGEGLTITDTINSLADVDLPALAAYEIGDVLHCLADNKLYKIGYLTSVTKKAIPQQNYYPEMVYGDGKKTLEMIGAPANMETIYHDGDAIVLPRFEFVFSSDLFGMGRNECPLVYSFWRGLKDSQNAVAQFPFASPHPYEPDGTAISGAVDLRFYDESQSAWQEWHKDFVRKVDGGLEVFATADMNLTNVFKWNTQQPIRQRNDVMVPKKLIYEIDQENNVRAEVQAIKLKP